MNKTRSGVNKHKMILICYIHVLLRYLVIFITEKWYELGNGTYYPHDI
jgi:hypothetical protein